MKSIKKKKITALVMVFVLAFSLFAGLELGSLQTYAQTERLTAEDFSVKDSNGHAKGPGAIYKPAVSGEILYWGSASDDLESKNQTLKFTGTLISPTENYNKVQFMVSMRASNSGANPWDSGNTTYWIYVENTSVFVRDGEGNTLFKTDDDRFSNVEGYADTRWALASVVDWCETDAIGTTSTGTRKTFYNRSHDYEFSAINDEGGVRIIVKIDGTAVLNWLDTASTVDVAGGFSVRTEDVYSLNISKMSFIGDDGQEINMLTEENISKLGTNSTGFGGYASATQWTMPLMNGGMGEIYTNTSFLDSTIDMDLRVDHPFDSENWILQLFLRDPTPNAFPWDDTSEFYKVVVYKNRIEFYRTLSTGAELIDTLYLGIGEGDEWEYWSTARHLKIVTSMDEESNVKFSVYLNNSSTELTTTDGSAGITDSSSQKITAAGGIGIWGNNNITKDSETGVYSYCQSVYIDNLTVAGIAQEPERPNDTETMVDLLSGNYMLDYFYGASYDAETNTIAIAAQSNTAGISYGEQAILNQYIDLTISNTGTSGWYNQIYLRDQAPGYASWEKDNLGGQPVVTFYNLLFLAENRVELYACVNGNQTYLSGGTLEGISFLNQNRVQLHIECENNDSGNPVIRIFDKDDNLLFRYEDTAKTITTAGGFTIISDTEEEEDTTVYELKANVVWRESAIYEETVDPNESPATVAGMQNLVKEYQMLSTKFSVDCTGTEIDLAGVTATNGDIARIYANYLGNAASQVVEMTMKYNSYQTVDNVDSDWLGTLLLADKVPGSAPWDVERTVGNGAYHFVIRKNDILVNRLVSKSSMIQITSFLLPENFLDAEHTFRFETYYEKEYTLIKVFVDGVYTYRMVDASADRITDGIGFTFLSKVSSTVTAMSANVPYVEKLPEFDLSKCLAVDFSELMVDTYDWSGQIRSNNIGGTIFHPNGIELLEGNTKNAGYVRDGVEYDDFYIDFNLHMTVTEEFLDRGVSDWIFMFNFRDSNPTYNQWDKAMKNAYGILAFYSPEMDTTTLFLRRYNNSTSECVTTDLAIVGGFDMMDKDCIFRVGTYNTEEGVRIAVWMNDKKIIDVLDTDDNAVTEAGSFMICMQGTVNGTTIPVVKSVLFEGLLPGEDRPDYVLGVNEPKPESAKLYPQDVYELNDLSAETPADGDEGQAKSGIWMKVLFILIIVAVIAVGVIIVLLQIQKKGGKQE